MGREVVAVYKNESIKSESESSAKTYSNPFPVYIFHGGNILCPGHFRGQVYYRTRIVDTGRGGFWSTWICAVRGFVFCKKRLGKRKVIDLAMFYRTYIPQTFTRVWRQRLHG